MDNKSLVVILILLMLSLLLNIYLINIQDNQKNTLQETKQTQTYPTPKNPILTNKRVQHIPISDSVYVSNIFNPDIIGKQNIQYSLAYVTLEPNSSIPLRSLANNEVQYYAKGFGKIIINNIIYHVAEGDTIFIPKNSIQQTINAGNTNFEIISIVDPAWTPEIETRYN